MLRQIPIRAATAAPSRLLFRPSFVATTRFLSTEATSTSQASSTPPPSSPASSTATQPQEKQLTYLVERTPSKHLSVYNDARAGGTRKQTVVKKIVGDARALRDELAEELKFPVDDVKINPVTGHIKIKVRSAVSPSLDRLGHMRRQTTDRPTDQRADNFRRASTRTGCRNGWRRAGFEDSGLLLVKPLFLSDRTKLIPDA